MIGTSNVRTLNATGKVKELTYEMARYNRHGIGLCEVRWKEFGETATDEGHKIFYSGKENKHKHGVGFLILEKNKTKTKTNKKKKTKKTPNNN